MTEPARDEKAIFLAALDQRTPAERAAYLADACAGDRELECRVQALLASHEQSRGPLDTPPSGVCAGASMDRPSIEQPNTWIGPYKLRHQIGEGGMGVVYMAEQKQPVVRRVALKIIKPGMDSHQVVARFEAARQALAMMDHPNIAKVLDAGTTENGRPYFVMSAIRVCLIIVSLRKSEYCPACQK